MNNVRGLFPPLYGAPANGGGGGGGSIQVKTLPEASLEHKDKIVQYTGATTDTLINGYFYKCIEHTVTEGETITVTYSWDNVPVMEVEGGLNIPFSTTPQVIGKYGNDDVKMRVIETPTITYGDFTSIINSTDFVNIKQIFSISGMIKSGSDFKTAIFSTSSSNYGWYYSTVTSSGRELVYDSRNVSGSLLTTIIYTEN